MKVEIKSMFLGIALGGIGVFSILFLIGNVETEFSLSTGDNNQNKNTFFRSEIRNIKKYHQASYQAPRHYTQNILRMAITYTNGYEKKRWEGSPIKCEIIESIGYLTPITLRT